MKSSTSSSERAAVALLLCLCATLTAACRGGSHEKEKEDESASSPRRLQQDGKIQLLPAERAALDVEVAPAVEGDLPNVVLRFGQVRATFGQENVVVAPVAGRIPRAPVVRLGSNVEAGAPLVEIVPVLGAAERIDVNVRGAELVGQIQGTQSELEMQRAALDRARDLARSNIISQAKLHEAETAVITTQARLDALRRANGAQNVGQGAPVMLRAPAAGKVSTLNASVGSVVQQGDLLVRLLKPGPRWVDVAVSPEDATGEGYEVAAGNLWIRARLLAAGTVAESDGTRRDRLEVDEASSLALVTGQIVSVRIAHGQSRGVVLPDSAVVPGVQTDLVLIESAANTFTPTPVRIAARFDGKVRAASGVNVGDRVVVRGAMSLHGESRRAELGGAD